MNSRLYQKHFKMCLFIYCKIEQQLHKTFYQNYKSIKLYLLRLTAVLLAHTLFLNRLISSLQLWSCSDRGR